LLLRAGGVRFLKPGEAVDSWAFVNLTRKEDGECWQFAQSLMRMLRDTGMRVNNDRPAYHVISGPPFQIPARLPQELRTVCQKVGKRPQLLVFLVDTSDSTLYQAIKRECSVGMAQPIASQVLQAKKAFDVRGQQQYLANVALKINIKLGGANHIVNESDVPAINSKVMMVGADVTHPPQGSGMPSIAASVAQLDGPQGVFSNQITAQFNPDKGQSQEIILAMDRIFVEHFRAWRKHHKDRMPESVVLFRDGISEGQFTKAMSAEAAQIEKAWKQVAEGEQLKLTYIVCTKRHNVRFFAANPQDISRDKSGNLPAGTVVDRDVVHPVAFEFYIQSQAGLIGTARPCKYLVLRNDGRFTSDALQRTIYSLCYAYSRATRSVSLIPVTYYSDVLCEKARAFIYTDTDGASSVSSGREQREVQVADEVLRKLGSLPSFAQAQWYM
jgi:eukaryotic translation initiation factor 2C